MHDGIETDYRKADGTPFNTENCGQVDHQVTTFTISIRHMNALSADQLKELIQKQFEVTACGRKSHTVYMRS